VAGKSLSEIGGLENSLVLLTSVGDKAEIPKGSTVLEPGMSVVLIVPTGDAATLEMFAGKPEMLP
jgi:Trk K+ transport system NAD-binding subunit